MHSSAGPVDGACRKTFCAFDLCFSITSRDGRIVRRLAAALPPGARAVATHTAGAPHREYSHEKIGGTHFLKRNGLPLCDGENFAALLEALENDAQFFAAQHAPRRVFVHAGVVGWKGRALIFPGRSCSGKSTLIAALLRAGTIYYSDEYAVFDAEGRVHPYPRALSLRRENGPPQRIAARKLGARTGTQALPAGAIFVCRYEPNAPWNPQQLSPGEAALALLANAVAARARTREVLPALEKAAGAAPAFQSARGEADAVAQHILQAPLF